MEESKKKNNNNKLVDKCCSLREEREVTMSTHKADDMWTILVDHYSSPSEETMIEYLVDKDGLKGILLKFHCELNPIEKVWEKVWGQAKTYSRTNTSFTSIRLQTIIDPAWNSVSTGCIRKHFRRLREYESLFRREKDT